MTYGGGRLNPHYNSLKTHCPKGHKYTKANTIVGKKGRSCRKCHAVFSKQRTTAGYYVEGYRDKECPICGDRWFVNIRVHIGKKHGVKRRDVPPGPVANPDWVAPWLDPEARAERYRKWAPVAIREQKKGGAYIKRLAKKWNLTKAGARSRLHHLAETGMITYPLPGTPKYLPEDLKERRSKTCGRGHKWTKKNTLIKADGTRHCRECARIAGRELYERKAGRPIDLTKSRRCPIGCTCGRHRARETS